jgi:hypothetical protein
MRPVARRRAHGHLGSPRILITWVVWAGLMALPACTSLHTPPTGGPIATLVLDSNQRVVVQAYANEACAPSPAGTRIALLHPTEGERLRGTAKQVAAGAPMVVSVQTLPGDGVPVPACQVTARFTPVAQASYILTFRHDPEANSCQVVVLRRGEYGSVEPEPSFQALSGHCPTAR